MCDFVNSKTKMCRKEIIAKLWLYYYKNLIENQPISRIYPVYFMIFKRQTFREHNTSKGLSNINIFQKT